MGTITDNKLYLTFDDVQLIPQYSEIQTREKCSLSTRVTKNYHLNIPVLASPMDTICESRMAITMMKLGGAGIIHRFLSIEAQAIEVSKVFNYRGSLSLRSDKVYNTSLPIIAAIGVTNDYMERAVALAEAGVDILLLDVAHGHHIIMKEALIALKLELDEEFKKVDIIVGNIATQEAAEDLCIWGADGIRQGIGGGSLCSTRKNTGHGVPMVSSIMEIANVCDLYDIPVIADGGFRTSGDIAKAIGAGAECVILGSMISATEETPGIIFRGHNGKMYKNYRGSASIESKTDRGEKRNIEGVATVKPYKGSVEFVINEIKDNLKSALSYSGTSNIYDFILKCEFIKVTNAGMVEAGTHGI